MASWLQAGLNVDVDVHKSKCRKKIPVLENFKKFGCTSIYSSEIQSGKGRWWCADPKIFATVPLFSKFVKILLHFQLCQNINQKKKNIFDSIWSLTDVKIQHRNFETTKYVTLYICLSSWKMWKIVWLIYYIQIDRQSNGNG